MNQTLTPSTVPVKKSIWERLSETNWIGLVPFFAFIFFFLLLPSTNLLFKSFQDFNGNLTLSNYAVMQNPYVIKAYRVSLQVSVITSVVGGVFGFFVAYAITLGNTPKWMRNFLMTFSGLAANFGGVPLAFSYIATLGRTGFVTAILKSICYPDATGAQVCPFNPYDNGFNLYSMTGLVLAYTYFQFPLMVLTITPALEGLKKEWREASSNLGASSWQYWRDVALPILAPSILGATLLLFGSAFGAYATAYALTGGRLGIITIQIGAQIRGDVLHNPGLGYAMAMGMVIIMAISLVGYSWLQKVSERWLR